MWKVNVVMVMLVIGGVVHGLVAMMAALNFMWWTAALAAVVSIACVAFVDKLEEEFYQ